MSISDVQTKRVTGTGSACCRPCENKTDSSSHNIWVRSTPFNHSQMAMVVLQFLI